MAAKKLNRSPDRLRQVVAGRAVDDLSPATFQLNSGNAAERRFMPDAPFDDELKGDDFIARAEQLDAFAVPYRIAAFVRAVQFVAFDLFAVAHSPDGMRGLRPALAFRKMNARQTAIIRFELFSSNIYFDFGNDTADCAVRTRRVGFQALTQRRKQTR